MVDPLPPFQIPTPLPRGCFCATPPRMNELYYGDNLDVLRRKIASESVDLCYIDPPFNSKRNYFQIYNNQGSEDRAQAQAFVDTWNWGDEAVEGLDYILDIERLNGKAGETRWTEETMTQNRIVVVS